jgi:hypothetical protein
MNGTTLASEGDAGRLIPYRPKFNLVTGKDAHSSIVLQQLLYWRNYWYRRGKKNFWLYKERPERLENETDEEFKKRVPFYIEGMSLEEQLYMTKRQLDTAIKKIATRVYKDKKDPNDLDFPPEKYPIRLFIHYQTDIQKRTWYTIDPNIDIVLDLINEYELDPDKAKIFCKNEDQYFDEFLTELQIRIRTCISYDSVFVQHTDSYLDINKSICNETFENIDDKSSIESSDLIDQNPDTELKESSDKEDNYIHLNRRTMSQRRPIVSKKPDKEIFEIADQLKPIINRWNSKENLIKVNPTKKLSEALWRLRRGTYKEIPELEGIPLSVEQICDAIDAFSESIIITSRKDLKSVTFEQFLHNSYFKTLHKQKMLYYHLTQERITEFRKSSKSKKETPLLTDRVPWLTKRLINYYSEKVCSNPEELTNEQKNLFIEGSREIFKYQPTVITHRENIDEVYIAYLNTYINSGWTVYPKSLVGTEAIKRFKTYLQERGYLGTHSGVAYKPPPKSMGEKLDENFEY